jgi:hypothetical protein
MISIKFGTYSFTLGVVQGIYFYVGFQVLIAVVGQLLVFHSPKGRQQAVSNNECLVLLRQHCPNVTPTPYE